MSRRCRSVLAYVLAALLGTVVGAGPTAAEEVGGVVVIDTVQAVDAGRGDVEVVGEVQGCESGHEVVVTAELRQGATDDQAQDRLTCGAVDDVSLLFEGPFHPGRATLTLGYTICDDAQPQLCAVTGGQEVSLRLRPAPTRGG